MVSQRDTLSAMAAGFNNIRDLKRNPVVTGVQGFPVPMRKQMEQIARTPVPSLKASQPKRWKVKFPTPGKTPSMF